MKIDVLSITNNPDGSGTMIVDFDKEALVTFAKIGLLKVLTDEAERIIKEHEDEHSEDSSDN
jgi:hypothetical protein